MRPKKYTNDLYRKLGLIGANSLGQNDRHIPQTNNITVMAANGNGVKSQPSYVYIGGDKFLYVGTEMPAVIKGDELIGGSCKFIIL